MRSLKKNQQSLCFQHIILQLLMSETRMAKWSMMKLTERNIRELLQKEQVMPDGNLL